MHQINYKSVHFFQRCVRIFLFFKFMIFKHKRTDNDLDGVHYNNGQYTQRCPLKWSQNVRYDTFK